jgi:hypothetical protein
MAKKCVLKNNQLQFNKMQGNKAQIKTEIKCCNNNQVTRRLARKFTKPLPVELKLTREKKKDSNTHNVAVSFRMRLIR